MRGDGCVQLPSCWIRPVVVRRAVMEMFAWRAARVRFAWVGGGRYALWCLGLQLQAGWRPRVCLGELPAGCRGLGRLPNLTLRTRGKRILMG